MRILNATQHQAPPSQLEANVVNLPHNLQADLKKVITFQGIPSKAELIESAEKVVSILEEARVELGLEERYVMTGGAPFFTSILERTLQDAGWGGCLCVHQARGDRGSLNG